MNLSLGNFSLPLLSKELIERAANKRTYQLRLLFAVLLYFTFFVAFWSVFAGSMNAYGYTHYVGRGADMLKTLVVFLIIGVVLFVPATTAGTITSEKERDSLCLLLLTRLSPWQIILQKFFSSLVSILSLMLLALPLLAISYAYGGLSLELLLNKALLVLNFCAQVTAIAVMCSSFCRTTVAAFLLTYVVTGALFYTLAELDSTNELWSSCLSLGVALFLARFWLVRRASLSGASALLRSFGLLDRLMLRFNRIFGNVQWSRQKGDLPGNAPIVWREMKQKALARPHYLIRLLLLVELPIIIFSLLLANDSPHKARELTTMGMLSLWALAVLVVSVNAANAFVSERIQQTLDVLLTTPLSARDIVQQKASVMRRLLYVVAIPIFTLSLMGGLFHSDETHRFSWLYLVTLALSLAIYLPLASWMSLAIGLICRTRFRAIITALGGLVLWSVVPIVIGIWITQVYRSFRHTFMWIFCTSPAVMPFLNEIGEIDEISRSSPWLAVALNFTAYGILLLLIRYFCLSRADHYLRR